MKEKLRTLHLSSKKRVATVTTLNEIPTLFTGKQTSISSDDKLNSIPDKKITKIKKIKINKFRGLENIEINIADNITLICGKNGTNKSTLLGIIAQCFSFSTDYTKIILHKENGTPIYGNLPYKTIAGKNFISYATEHFRLSEKYDNTGTMDINIEIYDAINNLYLDKLQLRLTKETNSRGEQVPRSRLRNNQGKDRTVTHPVIYLGLKRLFPISERKYEERANDKFIEDNISDFIKDNNFILMKKSKSVTTTVGIVNSMVAYGDNYDHQSVSVGEDNLGQILQAIYSFKKLKQEMGDDYKGGILLIDEIDSSLFCAAQIRLLRILEKYSKELKLQIILTSHSLDIMEKIHDSTQKKPDEFKLYYLTNSKGKIDIVTDIKQIRNDIRDSFPDDDKQENRKINIYTEDQEARDFLLKLLDNNKLIEKLNLIEIDLGYSYYKKLISDYKIPEFTKNSIVVLDGDQSNDASIQNYNNLICLPSPLSPEQLLFEFLWNMDDDDIFWDKTTRSQFISLDHTIDLIQRLNIDTAKKIYLESVILDYRKSVKNEKKTIKLRKQFKKWYLSDGIQYLINDCDLYGYWIKSNQITADSFIENLERSFNMVLRNTSK